MNTKRGSRVTRSGEGKTDWVKLKETRDAAIRFTKDAPRTSAEDWAEAVAHRGLPVPVRKEQIALRVDSDLLAWFRSQGSGWQTRMNDVLKAYRKAMAGKGLAEQVAAGDERESGIPTRRARA